MTNLLVTLTFFLFSFSVFSQPRQSILERPNTLKTILLKNNVWGEKIFVGYSRLKKPVYAYYYNRGGTDKAMIIGGVHGSEFYGVDVVNAIKDSLTKINPKTFKWKIIILPELFPDNVEYGRANIVKENYGRKTCELCFGQKEEDKCENHCVDPNRQMPYVDSLFVVGRSVT